MSLCVPVPTRRMADKTMVSALVVGASSPSPAPPTVLLRAVSVSVGATDLPTPLAPPTIRNPPSVGTPASCRFNLDGSTNREAEVLDMVPHPITPVDYSVVDLLNACITASSRVGTPASLGPNIDDSINREAEVPDRIFWPTSPGYVVVGPSSLPLLSYPPVASILVAHVVRPVTETTHGVGGVVPPAGRACSLVPAT